MRAYLDDKPQKHPFINPLSYWLTLFLNLKSRHKLTVANGLPLIKSLLTYTVFPTFLAILL